MDGRTALLIRTRTAERCADFWWGKIIVMNIPIDRVRTSQKNISSQAKRPKRNTFSQHPIIQHHSMNHFSPFNHHNNVVNVDLSSAFSRILRPLNTTPCVHAFIHSLATTYWFNPSGIRHENAFYIAFSFVFLLPFSDLFPLFLPP